MFTHCYTDDAVGIHSKVYVLAIGLLTSQYSLLGYDTSAHMVINKSLCEIKLALCVDNARTLLNDRGRRPTDLIALCLRLRTCIRMHAVRGDEEVKNAEWSGPMGIVVSIALSSVFGWIYLVALTSAVTADDVPSLLDPTNDAGGNAIAQALYATFRRRFGSGAGGVLCLAAMAVAIFLCGVASVTSNSRMGYAFSRDGAMPLSQVWYRVNKQEVPFNVVWLSVSVAFVMALTVRQTNITMTT